MKLTITLVALLAAAAVAHARVQPIDLVMTPVGQVHRDCLHEMNHGDHIVDDYHQTRVVSADGSTRVIPPCTVPRRANKGRRSASTGEATSAEGWQAYTQYNNPSNATFTYFGSTFNVPDHPQKWPIIDDAILYLFPGLQNDDWVPEHAPPFPSGSVPPTFDIIQPVLQYGGGSSNGGGRYWGVASWYVSLTGGVMVSKLTQINPGDSVFGNMTKTGDQSWFVGSKINSNGVTTNIQVTKPRLQSQSWAFVTLETYNIESCEDFPVSSSPSKFTGMQLTAQDTGVLTSIPWQVEQGQGNLCGASATSSNNGADVVINWGSGEAVKEQTIPQK